MDATANLNIKSILMTADTIGGVWTYALALARSLRPYGITVHLATMGAPLAADQREQVLRLDNLQLFESSYRLEWMDDPWESVERAGEWLQLIEQRTEPDLVHLNGYAHAALAWSCPVVVVAHSCVLSWWRSVKEEDAPAAWDRYRSEVSNGLACADAVVAPSAAMLRELRSIYNPKLEGVVIPNACDAGQFAPGDKLPCIFSAGRIWDEAKNTRVLDRIADRLSWPVYIAGDAQHPDGRAYERGAARLLGRLPADAAREWYARASIYALIAKYEPFGLSILEAALSGCALVLGDIPSLRENWDGAALFVNPSDDNAVEQALEMLIADDELRSQLGGRARARALDFTPSRQAESYMALYRPLVRARRLKTCA